MSPEIEKGMEWNGGKEDLHSTTTRLVAFDCTTSHSPYGTR